MNSIKIKFTLFFILPYLMLSGAALHASGKTVTFGFDSDYPPFSYMANNIAQGYEIDLIKLIFEKGDYKLDIKYGYTWDEIYKLTTSNQLDICGPLVRTPVRAEQVYFTNDTYTRYYGVFTNGNTEKITFDNLGKYRLGAVKGYYSEIIVRDQLKAASYEVFETYMQMILALKENRIDAFVEITEVVKYYILKSNLEGQVILQHDGLFPQSVPFGIAKSRPDLVEFINKRLKEIKSSGEYEIIYIKNFSSHSPEYYAEEKKKDLCVIIDITTGLVAVALLFIILLKLQVKRATAKIMQRESEIKKKNEELESINEELNQSLEEMDASTEELITVSVELRESEEKFRFLVRDMQVGVLLQGPKAEILMSNPKALELLGLSEDQLLGKTSYDPDWNVIHEDGTPFPGHTHPVPEAIASGKPVHNIIMGVYRPAPDGRVWLLVDAEPQLNDDGTVRQVVCTFIDITSLKKAEDKVQTLLTEKELLLSEVHHRIKNNMNTIKGLLTLQLSAEENQSAAASLRDAESRVQSMILLYDRLYCTDNYRELSVKDYLQKLAEEIVGSFQNRGIVKVETEIDDFILNVQKLSPLGIIVNELFTNMMKYAFTGRDSGVINLRASMKDNRVKIIIQDNGVGIPEAIDFKRSTGFGLDLVEMLMEQIGGNIKIERGDGTRFVIEFDV